jgi:hypothetical protein
VQRLERDVGGPFDAYENGAVDARRYLPRERGADQRLAVGRSRDSGYTMELPEAIVDAVHAHVADPPAAVLPRDEAARNDERRHRLERAGKQRFATNVRRQLLAEERR